MKNALLGMTAAAAIALVAGCFAADVALDAPSQGDVRWVTPYQSAKGAARA